MRWKYQRYLRDYQNVTQSEATSFAYLRHHYVAFEDRHDVWARRVPGGRQSENDSREQRNNECE